MSRVDEALRRAARGSECADGTPDGGPTSDPPVRHVHQSFLERYEAEKPAAREPAVAVKPAPPRTPSRERVAAAPAPGRAVTYRAQLAGFDPSLQGKLVISGDISALSVEQYRRLAATLGDLQAQRGLKTIMISSAVPREGKTLTVANLALTLSESYNHKVLLIDADLRRPSVHDVFGFPNKAGLADLARRGTSELPLVEVGPRLTVLPAGHLDTNAPTAELTSEFMRTVMKDAAAHFDWVLLDTPPVTLLPDANLISRVAEGVVFVIAAGTTPYSLVQRAIAELGPDRIIGTVLNRIDKGAFPVDAYYRRYYQTEDSDHTRRR